MDVDTRAEVAPPPIPRGGEVQTIAAIAAASSVMNQRRRPMAEIMESVREEITALAKIDPAKARYKFRFGGHEITGLSVDGAMAVAREYGNLVVVDDLRGRDGDAWIIAGIVVDIQRGVIFQSAYRQRECPPGGLGRRSCWTPGCLARPWRPWRRCRRRCRHVAATCS